MQTKVKIWIYVLSGLVLYFVGAMASLMYENGLPLNIAWNWAIKGSTQIHGFMIMGAILTFVWMDLILHLVRIRQWIYLLIFSIILIIGYCVSNYLLFLILGIFGLCNLVYLGYILYKEKNTPDVLEEAIENQEIEEEVEIEEVEEVEEKNLEENLDLLQDYELQEKIDALFDNDLLEEVKASELEESNITIDSLTKDYLNEDQQEKDC